MWPRPRTSTICKARLVEQARALGFAAVGFAPAADDPLRARRLHEWLAEGHHGEMEWMEARADVRQGPQRDVARGAAA